VELTRTERAFLEGSEGAATRKAMEVLVALGKVYGAARLIKVTSAHVAGVSYRNLGEAGLEFLEEMATDGKVRVPTTLNPAGMDVERWSEMQVDRQFAADQLAVVRAFEKMGIAAVCTCTPYLVPQSPACGPPGPGEHIAWSESSAVAYANSVLGARTNREGGPSALASALTGRTPEYGLHLDEARQAEVTVMVEAKVRTTHEFGCLGHVIGNRIGNRIPYVRKLEEVDADCLKSFAASIATFGGTGLFHIEGVTSDRTVVPKETVVVRHADLELARADLTDAGAIDFVSVGCPHCSIEELKELARLLSRARVTVEFWVATARSTKELADQLGYAATIEESGARLVCDTCLAAAPLAGRFQGLATNSAKGCYYARGSNRFRTRLCSLEDCVRLALGG